MTRETEFTTESTSLSTVATSSPLGRRSLLKYAGAGAAVIGASGLLAACGGSDGSAGATGGTDGSLSKMTPFTVGSSSGDNFLIDAINVDQKQFEKHNLKVPKLVIPQSVPQALQLLAAGAISGAAMDTMVAINSFANSSKGKRGVIVGMRMPVNTYNMIVGKGDYPADTATFEEKMASLKGKKIGVTAIGAGTDHMLGMALQAAGMKRSDVTPVGVGQIPAAIAQMKTGRLDAYVGFTFGSGLSVASQVGGRMLIEFAGDDVPKLLSGQQVCPVLVREDTATDKQDVVDAWLAAQWDAKTWVEGDKAAAADLLNQGTFGGKFPQESAAAIDFMVDKAFPKVNPNWKVDKAGIDQMIELMEQSGVLKSGAVTYEDIVPAFARA